MICNTRRNDDFYIIIILFFIDKYIKKTMVWFL